MRLTSGIPHKWRLLTILESVVEFETHEDLREAITKLDNTDFKGARVNCVADVSSASHTQLGLPS